MTLRLASVGSPQDAPAFFRLKFGEIAKEMTENSADYDGWISRGWIQEEFIHVDVLPAELTVVPVATMQEMGRLCFELGNRHLSLSIGEKEVSVPYDEPTFLYLAKLGFKPEKKKEKFTHFTVCHAHGHSHGEDTHSHDHAHAGEGHSH